MARRSGAYICRPRAGVEASLCTIPCSSSRAAIVEPSWSCADSPRASCRPVNTTGRVPCRGRLAAYEELAGVAPGRGRGSRLPPRSTCGAATTSTWVWLPALRPTRHGRRRHRTGGILAALYGTWALLGTTRTASLKAFCINKFRGDESVLTPGLVEITRRTGVPSSSPPVARGSAWLDSRTRSVGRWRPFEDDVADRLSVAVKASRGPPMPPTSMACCRARRRRPRRPTRTAAKPTCSSCRAQSHGQ